MPKDRDLNESLLKMYDEVRKYFLSNPHEECIPLLLNSFGEYGGMGVYQLVEDVILRFEHDKVVEHLIVALRSNYNGVKYWCAQICALFPDEKLINPLLELINDPNSDIRIAAITSLSQIQDDRVVSILKNQQSIEQDEVTNSYIVSAIEDMIRV